MLWHHGAAVHRKRVNVRKRSKMLALANGSLIEMHTPRHWALTEEVEDDGEPFEEKMTRLTSELSEMFAKSHELEDEIRKKLGALGYEI